MEVQLQELIEKIKTEGIGVAEEKATSIIKEAEEKMAVPTKDTDEAKSLKKNIKKAADKEAEIKKAKKKKSE